MLASRGNIGVRTWILTGLLLIAAVLARLAQPTLHESTETPQFDRSVPERLGHWSALADPVSQVSLSTTNETDINQPYDQTLMRGYVDDQGRHISLALAWGKRQRQEVKIHRPELCYPAQGFTVRSLENHTFDVKSGATGQPIVGKRMVAIDRNGGMEVVSYWIRIGHIYSDSPWQTRMHILREGLAGRITDGLLMRVSQRVAPTLSKAELDEVFQRQEQFAAALVTSVTPATRDFLAR